MRATPRGRQYTLILIGDASTSVRKVQLPARRIRMAAALLVALAIASAGLLAHYASILVTRGQARGDVLAARTENDRLRAQLHAVEDRIAHITATLDRVAQFDTSLRGSVRRLQVGSPGATISASSGATLPASSGSSAPASSAPPGAGVGGPVKDTPTVGGPAPEPPGGGRGAGAVPEARGAGAPAPKRGGVGGPVSNRGDIASGLASLDRAASTQETSLRALSSYFEAQHALLSTAPTAWPARGWVTSDFGERLDPYTAERMMHRGLDIATSPGYPVVAPSDGTVTFAGTEDGYGKVLILDHGHGVNTRYGHLSAIYVKAGQQVKRGARVAAVGNTGRSTGPHLHYEVRVNGVAENPRKFLTE